LTLKAAVAFAPEAVSVTLPNDLFPAVNVTLPVGAAVPVEALTVAVT